MLKIEKYPKLGILLIIEEIIEVLRIAYVT